jgi:hypothetical protein
MKFVPSQQPLGARGRELDQVGAFLDQVPAGRRTARAPG